MPETHNSKKRCKYGLGLGLEGVGVGCLGMVFVVLGGWKGGRESKDREKGVRGQGMGGCVGWAVERKRRKGGKQQMSTKRLRYIACHLQA